MKKLWMLVCVLSFFLPTTILAKSYRITNLYLEAEVGYENVYNITEYYNVYFEENSSFQRKLPLQMDVYTSNNKSTRYVMAINHFSTKHKYVEEVTNKTYGICFEKEKKDTNTTYLLSYEYNMGNDKDSKADIIFLNLIDKENIEELEQMRFSLTVKDIKTIPTARFYLDSKDITNLIDYEIEDNVITGSIDSKLLIGNTLSLQIILEEGYFKHTVSTISYVSQLYILFPLFTLLIVFILHKRYKSKHEMVADIENLDSLEIAYLYRGKIRIVDVISVIFHLANDGYLKIKNYGGGNKVQYKLVKVKPYDKENAGEAMVFDGLFQSKEEVDARSIDGIFYPYLEEIRFIVENKKNFLKLFHPKIKKYRTLLASLIACSFIVVQIGMLYYLLNTYFLASLVSIVLGLLVWICIYQLNTKKYMIIYVLLIVLFSLGGFTLWPFPINLIVYEAGILLLLVTLYLYSNIQVRTIYGNTVFEKIEKQKQTLMTMNEQMLKNHLMEDNDYVYKMLPYTVIFDMYSLWLQKCARISLEKPSWYMSSEPYTLEKLASCLENIISSFSVCMQTNKKTVDELLNQSPNKLL